MIKVKNAKILLFGNWEEVSTTPFFFHGNVNS